MAHQRPGLRRILAGTATFAVAATGLTLLGGPQASAAPAGDELVISEIYGGGGNSGAAFKNDFIELYNPTNAPIDLSTYSVTAHQSSGPAYGPAQALTGTLAPGKHFLIQEGAGNGNGADLPTADLVPATPFGMAGTNTAVQLHKGGAVVDAVGTGSATIFEGAATAAMTNSTSASRNSTGGDTDNNVADFTLGTPTPTNSGGTGPVDPVEENLTIAEIQGTGATSPKVGVIATTTGVVTAQYPTGGFNGFYLQTGGPDTTPDASDGLFVYAPGNDQSTFAVGDTVTVTGAVSEFGSQTQVTATTITAAATAQPAVVAKTTIPGTDCALPGTDCLDQSGLDAAKEKSEGELFDLSDGHTVTDVYDGSAYNPPNSSSSNFFGEIGIAANSTTPLVTPTEVIDAQDTAAIAARVKYNNAHRVVLDDGSSTTYWNTANTAAGMNTPVPWLGKTRTPRVGAGVEFTKPVILDYRFGWKVQPTSPVTDDGADQVTFEDTRAQNLAPADVGGDFKLATFNVLNYFTTLGTDLPAGTCTSYNDRAGNPIAVNRCDSIPNGPRGAWDQASFERQQAKIVKAINTMDADIVSLEEIENSAKVDGHDRDEALQALVTALNTAAGSTRWAFVPSPTGTDLPPVEDEDVIRTAFIYDPSTTSLVGASKMLVGDPAFENAREPLAQVFRKTDAPAGKEFAVIVNHFKSKGSGTNDGTGQGNANPDRIAQAEALGTFAQSFSTERDVAAVFLSGDFNAYSMEDPIQSLEADGFTNLASDDAAEWSYNFDGQVGSLDHVLANEAAEALVTGVDLWETNANESVFHQYSRFNYNAAELFDATSVFSASDHNPEVVGMQLGTEVGKDATTTTGTAAAMTYGTPGTVSVQVTGGATTPTGTVTATVNGAPVELTLVDGRATLPLGGTVLEPGSHDIALAYSGDATHEASTGSVSVVVAKARASVKAKVKPKKIKAKKTRAKVKVVVSAKGFVPTGKVTVKVKGQKAKTVSLKNGKATVKLAKFKKKGTYKVKVTYRGSDLARPVTKVVKVKVRR